MFLFFFGSVFFVSKDVLAQQTENVCYSQCIAYKFVWQGTSCYDEFEYHCTEDSGSTFKKTIKFLKDVYKTLKSGDGVDTIFTSWFVCKPLIENCIVPHQQNCRQTCGLDQYVYAPDLSVGHPDSSFHGVYFDEKTKQLYFKLVNNGMGYAWDIDVEATSGHTPNRDGKIQGGTQLFKEKIEHLIYLGARNGPPKSLSDAVGDFLIEESLNGQYLHDFKSWLVDSLDLHSDSKNYNVPNYWIKAVPFDPKPGELNRIIFNVDSSNLIPEYNELNNTFILDIDLRPTPARFTVENFSQELIDQTLNSFMVSFQVKNTGEESGLAKAKIYEGKYQDGKTPIHQSEENIAGKSDKNFETTIDVDLSQESNPYCGKRKEYTIVVTDEEGNKTERSFYLPIYIGSINGNVEDLFGKPVIGATVKASTGQETTTGKYGSYSLKGITSLGRIAVTVTHREFSKPETKEVMLKYVNEFEACDEGNLKFYNIDFVLKDQDVIFTVTIKDQSGNPVNAHVVAVNSDFRTEADISGSGPLKELQPGKYLFTVSAPGYKTFSQDVNAVPENVNLQFVLEKLNGRPDDTGLHLITPRLLWQKTLGAGERIISNMSGSKNGKLLVAYALDNKAKNSNLYFLDPMTGNQIKETPVSYGLGYEGKVGLDTSYDGGTVGLAVSPGNNQEGIVKVFSAGGNEIGTTTIGKTSSVRMDVSPDGFYLCPGNLFNKGLHKYTRYETEGKMDYKRGSRESAKCGKHFLNNNNIVIPCDGKQEGYCEETLANQQVRVIGDVDEGMSVASTISDSAFDSRTTVVRTYEKLYYFGASSWKKELKSDNMYKSVAVSPGGMYTIVAEGSGGSLKLKVYDGSGTDKTPVFPYKNVKFVFANDKGLFFAQVVLNRLEFYQIGEYDSDYQPETVSPTVSEDWTSGLSYMGWANQFYPAGNIRFADLDAGVIYRADRDINLKVILPFTQTSLGTLTITKNTLFSVNYDHNPVLIKGQLAADFNAPFTIYAIKFDRDWSRLFQEKLNDFIHHLLPEDEYFIVKNIHTKFTVKNGVNNFNVSVDSGDVRIIGKKINETVSGNKQITIDGKNNIKKSFYFGPVFCWVAGLVLFIFFGILLFIKRKTPFGKKIISVLKIVFVWIWKIIGKLILLFWKGLKIIGRRVTVSVKNLFKKKHAKGK